jgi:deoxyribodipyrimidine photo-lyase
MQRSQRESCNHALEYAVERAGELGLPLMVLFVLTPSYPQANLRHYRFMVEGLSVTAERLRSRGIGFSVRVGDPVQQAAQASGDAALLVGDRSYLREPRRWRQEIAARLSVPYHEVESDAVVPIGAVSGKEEYSAGTLRPKLHRVLFRYLEPLQRAAVRVPWSGGPAAEYRDADGQSVSGPLQLLQGLGVDDSVAPVEGMPGGEEEAQRRLERFIEERLPRFDDLRNDPAADYTSGLSPYLHFGQISPLTVALAALERSELEREGFLEELVVRRELSFNFTWYDPFYDSLRCLPNWARETLEAHEADRRDPSYSLEQLETAQTHDPYWNAAQRELLHTGAMHGYMRMYWGKKILEWTPAVDEAFSRALYLNNRYALDGRDPNSYAGIAWCFGKHDRAWTERAVFGKVRYMNDRGLRRKFKIDEYVKRVNRMTSGG